MTFAKITERPPIGRPPGLLPAPSRYSTGNAGWKTPLHAGRVPLKLDRVP